MAEKFQVFLSPPHQTGREREYIEEVLASNYVAPVGPMLAEFERDFSAYTGLAHAVAVSSGTAALHLALKVLGIGRGDRVWVSDLTFIGGVSPILYEQAIPTFIDSCAEHLTIDTQLLEQSLSQAEREDTLPKAIVVTDIYGQCVDYDAVRELCNRYEILLIADSAEAMGSLYKNRHAGFDADIAVYSFNGNKIITSSGGGMIASKRAEWMEKARYYATQAREPAAHYEHTEIGYNYRMSNVVAAIGRAQLEAIEERVAARRAINTHYREGLKIPGVSFLAERENTRMNHWLTVMLLDEKLRVSPEDIRIALEKERIEARPVWKPMHRQPVFKHAKFLGSGVSADFFKRGICLPSGSSLDAATQQRIIGIVHDVIQKH
jgi:dTDP-4-amino-4,6-dideoxygalactose transaminase